MITKKKVNYGNRSYRLSKIKDLLLSLQNHKTRLFGKTNYVLRH